MIMAKLAASGEYSPQTVLHREQWEVLQCRHGHWSVGPSHRPRSSGVMRNRLVIDLFLVLSPTL